MFATKCNPQSSGLARATIQSEPGLRLRQHILVVEEDLFIRRLNAEMLVTAVIPSGTFFPRLNLPRRTGG
jgi:hypothetical protein